MKRYTKEQLLFYLNKLAKELKKSPKISQMKYPSAQTYLRRFGTWNNALKSAGLAINVKKQFSKEELIENIKLLSKELGREPKPSDLKNKGWTGSYSTYLKYFGSWKSCLRQAGVARDSSTLRNYVKGKQI